MSRLPMIPLLAAIATLLLPAPAGAAPTITELDPATVVAGSTVTARGSVEPIAVGELVQLEQLLEGTWTKVGVLARTDDSGAWQVTFTPRVGGQVRATQLSGEPGSSAETTVSVVPRLVSRRVQQGPIYPFLGARAAWKVAGGYPDGPIIVQVTLDGRPAGIVRSRIADGRVAVTLPTRGVGRFQARLVLPARGGMEAARFAPVSFVVRGERVGPGSNETWNRSLRAALRWRGVHVPTGTRYDHRMGDAVIAFHKAYGRPRSTVFEAGDWQHLTRAAIRVQERGAGLHIEVDKSRQLLMQVRDGRPVMVIHVSTGRTGNTPVGRHRILWKGNWVPSLFDSMLYKSMAFRGAYAIHGYPSVPTSPASAGCVRVPMWIAAALYARSPVGTPVIVYERLGRGGRAPVARGGATPDVPELTGIDPARWADER
jgi:hypothetical protein